MGPSDKKGLFGAEGPFIRSGKGLPISEAELAAAATKAAEKVVGSTNDWNKDSDPLKDFPAGKEVTPETQQTTPYVETHGDETPDIAGTIRGRTTTTPTTVPRPAGYTTGFQGSTTTTVLQPPTKAVDELAGRPGETPTTTGELKVDRTGEDTVSDVTNASTVEETPGTNPANASINSPTTALPPEQITAPQTKPN